MKIMTRRALDSYSIPKLRKTTMAEVDNNQLHDETEEVDDQNDYEDEDSKQFQQCNDDDGNDDGGHDGGDDGDHDSKNIEGGGGGYFLRLRGLPWSATHKSILEFLKNVNVVSEIGGIHLVTNRHDGKNTGEAYVEVISEDDIQEAKKLHKTNMGHRYIEVFEANADEAKETLRKCNQIPEGNVVKLRGLPYCVCESDIELFFKGLEIKSGREGILFVLDRRGRATGEGYVQFETADDTEQALGRNREKIGHRYIEIFRSTPSEMRRAKSGADRSAPYDIRNRGGNRTTCEIWSSNSPFSRGGGGAGNMLGFNNQPNLMNSGNFGNGGNSANFGGSRGGNDFGNNGNFNDDSYSGRGGGGGGNALNNFDRSNSGNFGGGNANNFGNSGNFGGDCSPNFGGSNSSNLGANNSGGFGSIGNNRISGGGSNSGNFGCGGDSGNFGGPSMGNFNGSNAANFNSPNDKRIGGNTGGSFAGGNFGQANNMNSGGGGGGVGGGGGGGYGNSRFNGGNFGNDYAPFNNNSSGNFGGLNNNNFRNDDDFGGNDFRGNRSGGGPADNIPFGGNNNFGSGRNMEYFVVHMRGLPYSAYENEILKFFQNVRPANIRVNFNKRGLHDGTADAYFETYGESQAAMKFHREKMGSRYIELFFDGKGHPDDAPPIARNF